MKSIKNYLGNMEFTQSGNINTLEAAYHSEGRVLNNGTWEYNLKDHLGNVRIVFVEGVDRSGKIVQENHYYPFGMQQNGNWVNNQTVKNDYLYNGKELNTEIGLNWSDYGARFYDAAIGKWNSIDPLADHPYQENKSPYAYAWNNPVGLNDPDGKCPGCPPEIKDQLDGTLDGSILDLTPSSEVQQKIDEGLNMLQDVFDGSIEGTATVYGGEVEGELGPLKGKAGASVFTGKIKLLDENLLNAEGKFLNGNVGFGFASFNAEGSVTVAKGGVEVKKNLEVITSGEFLPAPAGNIGTGDGAFKMNLNNSSRIGVGAKVGPVKVKAGVNIGKLAKGTSNLIQAGIQYLAETTKNVLD